MMEVGIVTVFVAQRRMDVPMDVRLAGRVVGRMGVAMMRVVGMPMLVLHRLVQMLVIVPLDQMQCDTDAHEERRGPERGHGHGVKQGKCQKRADERGEGEIGTGPGGPEMAQSEDEHHEA